MQPYFLPYIGYFQLIAAADLFIIYDNIKYVKKGWINRNRMLQNCTDVVFSLPLKNDSDYLDIYQRSISKDFKREKLLSQFKGAYRRAPHFEETFQVVEEIIQYEDMNLFEYLHNSIVKICAHLAIKTNIKKSSEIEIDHLLKSEQKILAICDSVGADIYINAIGGMDLYSRENFNDRGVELKFIRSRPFEYSQFGDEFISWLSIIDVLMFNSRDMVQKYIAKNYDLI